MIVHDSHRFVDVLKKCTHTNKKLENLSVEKNKTTTTVIGKNDLNNMRNEFCLTFLSKITINYFITLAS